MKPHIALFFTGGTISMRVDPGSGGAVPALSGEEIIARVPGLDAVAACEVINYSRLPGPHMTPARMLDLAHAVGDRLTDPAIAGAVVTHGTDTLEETAYLLDLILSAGKPVVFVGAMKNSSELGWDGPANLLAAVRVAAEPAAAGLGVLVVMADQLLAAREATKTHTEAVDTFRSRDFGPVGVVDKDQVIVARLPAPAEPIPTRRIEERVDLIALAAGADGRFIDFAVAQGARGLVIEGLGRGNVPPGAVAAIERAVRAGLPVVIASRCPRGRVLDIYAYDGAGKDLCRRGAILCGMLPAHKARIKLMVLLGAGYDSDQIRRSFAVC